MVPDPPDIVTRRAVFSLCGRPVGHFPVSGWLRLAYRVPKRRASSVTKGWDDETRDNLLQRMISQTVDSVRRDDPAHGDWCVDGRELNAWVDDSSLAIGVALERHETMLEDACWLRPENDTKYINLAELDAVLKVINLALQWRCKVLHVKTDSVCAHHWVSDTLSGRTRVRTKAEMFIRRRLKTLKKLSWPEVYWGRAADRTCWLEVYWGRAASCVCVFVFCFFLSTEATQLSGDWATTLVLQQYLRLLLLYWE